MKKDTLGFEKG